MENLHSRPTETSETPPDGDFAGHIERMYQNGKPSPGQLSVPAKPARFGEHADEALQQIQKRPSESWAGWIVSFATMVAMGCLSYIALRQEAILVVSKHRDYTFEGSAAVITGFAFLAAALFPAINLSRHTLMFKPVTFFVIGLWLVAVWVYLN